MLLSLIIDIIIIIIIIITIIIIIIKNHTGYIRFIPWFARNLFRNIFIQIKNIT